MATLRGALRSYRGVELRETGEVLGERFPDMVAEGARDDGERSGEVTVLRTELVLAGPAAEPLARLLLDPDPLSPFAAALSSLRADDGERAEVCLDLLPVGGMRLGALRRVMRRQARRRPGRSFCQPYQDIGESGAWISLPMSPFQALIGRSDWTSPEGDWPGPRASLNPCCGDPPRSR